MGVKLVRLARPHSFVSGGRTYGPKVYWAGVDEAAEYRNEKEGETRIRCVAEERFCNVPVSMVRNGHAGMDPERETTDVPVRRPTEDIPGCPAAIRRVRGDIFTLLTQCSSRCGRNMKFSLRERRGVCTQKSRLQCTMPSRILNTRDAAWGQKRDETIEQT